MLSAINGYPLSSSSSNSSESAGPDFRKKISFDDLLLLPSIPSSSSSRNYLCYSGKVSPVLPPISKDVEVQRKYNTAPASPKYHNYYSNTVTPTTSPLFSRAQLVPTATTGFLPSNNNNLHENLPSLRHLQLLPDHRIQEYACNYPDTSERTPIWKRTLVHWCKETNYQDYTKIVHEVSHDRTQLSALLRESSSTAPFRSIPSVLKPKDAFQGLSDHARNASAPMTPPMSPARETERNQPPEFTAFVSGKLVQTVKQGTRRNHSTPGRHKKTNSFKAMQLKKLFNNRDILSNDSRTEAGKYKISKPSAAPSIASSTPSSSSPNDYANRLTKINIENAAKTLAITLDTQTKHATSPPRSASSITTPNLVPKHASARSRSPSPVRPATPPATASSSKYHKFAFDSPQSPIATLKQGSYSSSTKTTPKRRRSSGSSPHGIIRKCVSCHSNDSPCWRPSWSGKKQDQLCNSCGLRYKKTNTRCLNDSCRKIPTKGQLSIMRSNGIHRHQNDDGTISEGYKCLFCNSIAETSDTIPQTSS